MSAHTLDLEYAQSNFCTGGKRQLNKREGGKKLFLVDLSERNLCINAKAGS